MTDSLKQWFDRALADSCRCDAMRWCQHRARGCISNWFRCDGFVACLLACLQQNGKSFFCSVARAASRRTFDNRNHFNPQTVVKGNPPNLIPNSRHTHGLGVHTAASTLARTSGSFEPTQPIVDSDRQLICQ